VRLDRDILIALAIITVSTILAALGKLSEERWFYIITFILGYYFGSYRVAVARAYHYRPAYLRRLATIMFGAGLALMLEHYVVYGGFDPIWEDPTGHEWIGLILTVLGMLLLPKRQATSYKYSAPISINQHHFLRSNDLLYLL